MERGFFDRLCDRRGLNLGSTERLWVHLKDEPDHLVSLFMQQFRRTSNSHARAAELLHALDAGVSVNYINLISIDLTGIDFIRFRDADVDPDFFNDLIDAMGRTSFRSPEFAVAVSAARVPPEYALACAHLSPGTVVNLWNEGVPIEYAQEVFV